MPPVCGHKTGLALASGLWSTLAVDQKAHFDAALRALSSGNPQAAAEICEKSLEAFPGDANLLCLSARANLALRQYSAAEKNVEEAIQRFPDFALAHETFGDLLLVQGQGSKALSAYQTAMRLDPARTETHGKIDRARDLEKALQMAVFYSTVDHKRYLLVWLCKWIKYSFYITKSTMHHRNRVRQGKLT